MLLPGQTIPTDQVHALIVCIESEDGTRKYHLVAAGRILEAYPSLLENLDLLCKFFWVFQMNYTPTVQLVYRFIENFVYKQGGGRMPSCITELACVLRNNKEDPAIS